MISPLFFPADAVFVLVIKLGPGAFWPAPKAALIGGISAGILAGLIPSLIISKGSQLTRLIGTNVIIGVIIGAVSAYISTRP